MPHYLLDTHVLYRWMRDDRRLGQRFRKVLAQEDCAVSVASLWEMVIKSGRGKLALPDGSLGEAIQSLGFRLLAIAAEHVEASRRYDLVIQDPFDRLLVGTAAQEGLLLLTQDASILELSARTKLPVADNF